jgi:hypothetical protein
MTKPAIDELLKAACRNLQIDYKKIKFIPLNDKSLSATTIFVALYKDPSKKSERIIKIIRSTRYQYPTELASIQEPDILSSRSPIRTPKLISFTRLTSSVFAYVSEKVTGFTGPEITERPEHLSFIMGQFNGYLKSLKAPPNSLNNTSHYTELTKGCERTYQEICALNLIKSILPKNKINLNAIVHRLNNSQFIPGHNDLTQFNIFKNTETRLTAIDWDKAGLAPAGTEPGVFLFSRNFFFGYVDDIPRTARAYSHGLTKRGLHISLDKIKDTMALIILARYLWNPIFIRAALTVEKGLSPRNWFYRNEEIFFSNVKMIEQALLILSRGKQ